MGERNHLYHGTRAALGSGDEITPQRDPRVRENESYLTVLLLSRVVTKLGSLTQVHTGVIIQADSPVIGPYMSCAIGTIQSQQRRVTAIRAAAVDSRGQSTCVR